MALVCFDFCIYLTAFGTFSALKTCKGRYWLRDNVAKKNWPYFDNSFPSNFSINFDWNDRIFLLGVVFFFLWQIWTSGRLWLFNKQFVTEYCLYHLKSFAALSSKLKIYFKCSWFLWSRNSQGAIILTRSSTKERTNILAIQLITAKRLTIVGQNGQSV